MPRTRISGQGSLLEVHAWQHKSRDPQSGGSGRAEDALYTVESRMDVIVKRKSAASACEGAAEVSRSMPHDMHPTGHADDVAWHTAKRPRTPVQPTTETPLPSPSGERDTQATRPDTASCHSSGSASTSSQSPPGTGSPAEAAAARSSPACVSATARLAILPDGALYGHVQAADAAAPACVITGTQLVRAHVCYR